MFLRYFFCKYTCNLSKVVLNMLNFLKLCHCSILHDDFPLIFLSLTSQEFNCYSSNDVLQIFTGGQFIGEKVSYFKLSSNQVSNCVLSLLKIPRSFQKLQILLSLKYDLLWPFTEVFRFLILIFGLRSHKLHFFSNVFSYGHQYCCQISCLLVGYYQPCNCP